jgi:hypothetical protein
VTGRGTIATDGERPKVEQVAPTVEPREQSSVAAIYHQGIVSE